MRLGRLLSVGEVVEQTPVEEPAAQPTAVEPKPTPTPAVPAPRRDEPVVARVDR